VRTVLCEPQLSCDMLRDWQRDSTKVQRQNAETLTVSCQTAWGRRGLSWRGGTSIASVQGGLPDKKVHVLDHVFHYVATAALTSLPHRWKHTWLIINTRRVLFTTADIKHNCWSNTNARFGFSVPLTLIQTTLGITPGSRLTDSLPESHLSRLIQNFQPLITR